MSDSLPREPANGPCPASGTIWLWNHADDCPTSLLSHWYGMVSPSSSGHHLYFYDTPDQRMERRELRRDLRACLDDFRVKVQNG